MSFTTLDKVKAALSIPLADTSQDAVLTPIVAGVNAELLALFHLDECASKSYTKKYDIWDAYTEDIWLWEYPVISITEVKFNEVVQTDDGYYLKKPAKMGMLSLTNFQQFPVGRQLTEVTHVAGWAGGVVDDDLIAAATLMAIVRFNTDAKMGFTSERIGQYFYQLGGGTSAGIGASGGVGLDGVPIASRRILNQWIRPFVTDE